MIVVVSSTSDEHAQAVLDQLHASSSDVFLLDLSAFPQEMAIAFAYGSKGEDLRLRQSGREIPLADCRAVWWRRPGSFLPDPTIRRQAHTDFIYSECTEAFAGLWHLLDASWMNHPKRDEVAARKVFQLKVAREVGLEIPLTLVTNDPSRARSFIESLGAERVVYKAFSATQTEWRETRLLTSQEMELPDNVRYAPVIFQEYIEAAVDLRITVVGNDIFPSGKRSTPRGSAYKVDFRIDTSR